MAEPSVQANGSALNGAAIHHVADEAGESLDSITTDHTLTENAASDASPKARENPQPGDVSVAAIRKNHTDCRGEKVDFVFFRRRDYAIYRSGGKILVHYSDDENTAKAQVAQTAELLPLRGRLQYLMKDMPAPNAYHWQIAEALRLGLDGQKDAAKNTMQAAIDNIIARRVSQGRDIYLINAGAAMLVVLTLLCLATAIQIVLRPLPDGVASGLSYLMMAAGSGAVGAMLSTAMAFRARTMAVATDVDLASNAVDSAVRIMIGVISAAVLYLVLESNLFAAFSIAGAALKAEQITWQIAALVGFAAGFLERLVPDLLEKKLSPAVAK